jgi:hypothetical protein
VGDGEGCRDDHLAILAGVGRAGGIRAVRIRRVVLIAEYHLDLADTDCGVCMDGSPRKVCDAADELAAADADRAAINPDWSNVLDGYARSVERSIQAEQVC